MLVKPKVSVVTIVRNDPQGFLITARSILQQDYDNIEWIVVDGLSTDHTSAYVKNLSPAISSYKIEKDSGIYNAMNKGIDMLTGEWVIFMNADDVFYSTSTISEYIANLELEDEVLHSNALRREDRHVQRYRNDEQYWLGMVFDHQAAFVKSSLYKKYKYDESFKIAGDLNFFSNLRRKKYKFRKLDGMISAIKPFDVGVSSTYFSRQEERITVLRRYFDGPKLIDTLFKEFKNMLTNENITEIEYALLLAYIGKK